MDSRFKPLLLSLTAGLFLSASWYWHLSILLFFAFIPLLILEDHFRPGSASRSQLKLFGLIYLSFFIWNILVTWWIVYASFGGACMAILCNSLLMSLVFLIFSAIKSRLNKSFGIWFLIPLWIAWEHIHTLWDITWPWLTLGNVFAFNHQWVQWYEFTGTSGGTLWVLATNILVYNTLKNKSASKINSKPVYRIAAIFILPILLSYSIYFIRKAGEEITKRSIPVVVVQPNMDPYNEKFSVSYAQQFTKMLDLVRGTIHPETKYLVLPETFITGLNGDLNEESINNYREINWFRDSLLLKFPNLKIVTGGNTYRFYHQENEVTATARLDQSSGLHYDVYNSAIYIDPVHTEVYHKSKLVPGVERMPFPALLKPLESMAIELGGTMGSLGTQEERSVFKDREQGVAIAPVICYESIYADYVAEYVRNGANLIFIITNDGWWQNTPGYIQHLNFSRLRAIENRREIARCANTGISCFVDRYGNFSQTTDWWKVAVIEKNMTVNNSLTFFSRFGDLLSYLSIVLSSTLLIWALYVRLRS
ncbi:MAG: apolipoprotein N-acyltransferase [bacterium]|nr:apolipoprotein N-acyltransferase [bacterium]